MDIRRPDKPEAAPLAAPAAEPVVDAHVEPARPWRPGRRTTIATGLFLAALGVAGSWYAWAGQQRDAPVAIATPTPTPTPVPTPVTVPAPLTGLVGAPDVAARPITGVMIENLYPNARPQSGLDAAGIVYEALAEGGITRFLALYQQPYPQVLGPVRSLRPYYFDWASEYGAPVAHAGGSIPALAKVRASGLPDLEALAYDGTGFYRARDRYAPHNLYTSTDRLAALVQRLGLAKAPTTKGLPRKPDAPLAVPAHPQITVNFSTNVYQSAYTYDAASNSYARSMAGTPHVDRTTGNQIMTKNVVVQYVPTTYGQQANGKPETNLNLLGTGKVLVFTDGGVTVGTWTKTADAAPTTFTDAAGQPIRFNVGNTWFGVVPTTNVVTY